LRGDPSDGLPGAAGIGPKTAAELLARHGSLEGPIAAASTERPKIAQALTDQADELRAFRRIAQLQTVTLKSPEDRETDLNGGARRSRSRPARRRSASAARVGWRWIRFTCCWTRMSVMGRCSR